MSVDINYVYEVDWKTTISLRYLVKNKERGQIGNGSNMYSKINEVKSNSECASDKERNAMRKMWKLNRPDQIKHAKIYTK